jgi:hypothetical protein
MLPANCPGTGPARERLEGMKPKRRGKLQHVSIAQGRRNQLNFRVVERGKGLKSVAIQRLTPMKIDATRFLTFQLVIGVFYT